MLCPGCGALVIPGDRAHRDAVFCSRICQARHNSTTRGRALERLAKRHRAEFLVILGDVRKVPSQ